MTPLPCPCGRGMRAVLRDHAGNPVRLADRCKTCSGEAIRAADASPPGPARERATALIDALNKDGGGHVVHGALQAAMIAEANASDAARTPPRTSPVTPAERACATVLRTWLEWHETPPEPRGDAYEAMLNLGDWLADSGIVEGESLALTPAGRDLLARVEAEERTPTTVLFAMVRAYGDAETAARVLDYGKRAIRASRFHACRDELVCELARIENQGGAPALLGDLAADYAARAAQLAEDEDYSGANEDAEREGAL